MVNQHSSVVLEKPLGHDLDSCREINEQVSEVFEEEATFRIDHYLGKETVQNLIAVRFGNPLFSPQWRNTFIDNVQITVAEDIGVEGRGGYYAKIGALRDMVQNHVLQVLSIVAMEPPASLRPADIRDEKMKVLRALEPMTPANVKENTVRGRYDAGAVNGDGGKGLSGRGGIPGRGLNRDLCRPQGHHQQLALGRGALLPAHRQTAQPALFGNCD